ncbi:unnamed protein product, partial [Staurois parvus]
MRGPGRADIADAGSAEGAYSECGVRGGWIECVMKSELKIIIINAATFY